MKCSSVGRPPKAKTIAKQKKIVHNYEVKLGKARTKLNGLAHKYRRCKAK